jgi:hypothetical protein
MRIAAFIPPTGLAVLAAALTGCRSEAQEPQREVRELSGFTAIHGGGGVDLHVTLGEEFRVEISDGDPADLITEVKGTTLEIHPRGGLSGFFGWGADHDVSVTLPALEALYADGGTDVEVNGEIGGERLQLAASGGSDIELRVAVASLEVSVSGGSDVELSGQADSAALHASGGSDVDAAGFTARDVRVESSGGSDVSVGVGERLVGSASGGSDVTYGGNPQTVDVDTSGGSDLGRR